MFRVRKLLIPSLFVCLIFVPFAFAQNWLWQNSFLNSEAGTEFNDLRILSNRHGLAVGHNGRILRTNDSGATWFGQTVPTQFDLNRISENCEWVIGDHGTILNCVNDRNWIQIECNTTVDLTDIIFHGRSAWIVGDSGTILTSATDGIIWSRQTSGTIANLKSISLLQSVSLAQGWIVGDSGIILFSSNSGVNWTRQNSGTTNRLNCVSAGINGYGAVAFGDFGTILTIFDPGSRWQPMYSSTSQNLNWGDWGNIAVGDSGTILHSNVDVWEPLASGTDRNLYRNCNDRILGQNGIQLRSIDGLNWYPWSFYTIPNFSGISFCDTLNGWTIDSLGTVLRTRNGGKSWVTQADGIATGLNNVLFTDTTHGWIVCDSGFIARTTDGGDLWAVVYSRTVNRLEQITFSDPRNGWIVGWNGTILHTADSGNSWQSQNSGSLHHRFAIAMTDSSHGWVTGSYGTILHTTDGGLNWTSQRSGTPYDLYSVSFGDSIHGWTVGELGRLLRTTNGGQNWVALTSNTENSLRRVIAFGANETWICGDSGILLHTINGGENWTRETIAMDRRLSGMTFPDPQHGWIAGEQASILRYYNDGTNQISETRASCPDQFELFPNYPNPFNGITQISYNLFTGSLVRLKLFNLEGREIRTLVNRIEQAGFHRITLNCKELPSGVYFIRMQTGKAFQSRKLVLIK